MQIKYVGNIRFLKGQILSKVDISLDPYSPKTRANIITLYFFEVDKV